MKCFAVITGALVLGACGSSSEDCLDTYSSGANGDTYETTCSQPVSPPGAVETPMGGAELAAGDCVETFSTSCSVGEECQELYARQCEDAAGNVPTTEVGQLSQSLLIADCQIDNGEHTVTALRPVIDPFLTALQTINLEFQADNADVNFFLRTIQSRGPQGSLDVRALGILDVAPDDDGVTGRTTCIRDGATGDRGRCQIVVFRETVERVAAESGLDPFEVEYVTAMHEFGHTFCLDHKDIDSSAEITAMNSHHLRDATRPQLDYLRFLGSERDQVRTILRNP